MSTHIDLDRPRSLAALLLVAGRIWLRHLPVFVVLALVVVAPLYVAIDWLWIGGRDADYSGLSSVAGVLEHGILIPALVTAMHVVAVQDLGRGEPPSLRRSAAVTARLAFPLVLVTVAYLVLVCLGVIAIIVPGLVAAVRLYFGAQALVVDRRGVYEALHESGSVTGGWRWLRTLAVLVALWLLGAGVTLALTPAYDALDADAAWIALGVAERSLVVSFTALVGTLLFFDLRARRSRERPATRPG